MHAEERKALICARLENADFITIDEVAQLTQASLSTVRRDLLVLEDAKLLRRVNGGARSVQTKGNDYIFDVRNTQQAEEKKAIGSACAALVKPGQSVWIDSGTTCFHVAEFLVEGIGQIVTNSLAVAELFSGSLRRGVFVPGGIIYPRLDALIGSHAVTVIGQTHVDVAIMSASGLAENGIYNAHALIVDIQRAIIASAARVVFCMDHTKFDRRATFFLTDYAPVDMIVCDQLPADTLAATIRAHGVEIIKAGD